MSRYDDAMHVTPIPAEVLIEANEALFRHFWAKRVTGFDATVHCADCLRGPRLLQVNKQLARGGLATLNAKVGSLIYICGVASPRNWSNNFHLACRVTDGGRTVSQFYTGARVTVLNAVAVPIADTTARRLFPELPDQFLTCRNFQFGAQEFGRPGSDKQTAK